MKMGQTECFETSAYKIHTPENYLEESIKRYTALEKQKLLHDTHQVACLCNGEGLHLLQKRNYVLYVLCNLHEGQFVYTMYKKQ
jgi:hypothetical protein